MLLSAVIVNKIVWTTSKSGNEIETEPKNRFRRVNQCEQTKSIETFQKNGWHCDASLIHSRYSRPTQANECVCACTLAIQTIFLFQISVCMRKVKPVSFPVLNPYRYIFSIYKLWELRNKFKAFGDIDRCTSTCIAWFTFLIYKVHLSLNWKKKTLTWK